MKVRLCDGLPGMSKAPDATPQSPKVVAKPQNPSLGLDLGVIIRYPSGTLFPFSFWGYKNRKVGKRVHLLLLGGYWGT